MRQKRLKHVNIEMMKAQGVITDISVLNTNGGFLEVGSGKGQFITSLALDNSDKEFFALEKNIDVCYRILEKKIALGLDNLTIILGDANNLTSYFNKGSIQKIYLNFSDPWPKAKHHKRRLSYKPFLDIYKDLLMSNGELQLRTDHQSFFDDSLQYIECMFKLDDVNYNYKRGKYYTEYELKKLEKGNIYQLKASVKDE